MRPMNETSVDKSAVAVVVEGEPAPLSPELAADPVEMDAGPAPEDQLSDDEDAEEGQQAAAASALHYDDPDEELTAKLQAQQKQLEEGDASSLLRHAEVKPKQQAQAPEKVGESILGVYAAAYPEEAGSDAAAQAHATRHAAATKSIVVDNSLALKIEAELAANRKAAQDDRKSVGKSWQIRARLFSGLPEKDEDPEAAADTMQTKAASEVRSKPMSSKAGWGKAAAKAESKAVVSVAPTVDTEVKDTQAALVDAVVRDERKEELDALKTTQVVSTTRKFRGNSVVAQLLAAQQEKRRQSLADVTADDTAPKPGQ